MDLLEWDNVSQVGHQHGLSIRLLGDTEVRVDDQPISVDTRKAVALVAYLVVNGTSSSRDQLASLLWGELDADRARGALRRTLSVLRKALDGRWLTTDAGRVGTDSEPWVDVHEVTRLVDSVTDHGHDTDDVCSRCRDPYRAAVALHRGEFMAGFGLRDAPEFEDWQLHQAESARSRRGRILAKLADSLAVSGEFGEAAAVARQRVELEPLDEAAHRQVMLMAVWAGDRAAALRQYRECVRVLDDELGVPPLPETSALEERILSDDIPPTPVRRSEEPVPPEPGSPPPVSPTIGRDQELARLSDAVSASTRPAVAITGPPGVGKTRLLDEAAQAVGDRRVVRARAYEGEQTLGLVVIGEAMRAALQTWEEKPPMEPAAMAEVSRLVPGLVPTADFDAAPPFRDPGAQSRFTDSMGETLSTVVGDGLLILDDLQWADPASLELIAYLLRRTDRFPIQMMVAWRTPYQGERHPLEAIFNQLETQGDATVLALSSLPPNDIRELAGGAAPALDQESTEAVVAASDGIPLVALEYLSLIDAETGQLATGELGDVAEARLRGVGDLARQVLAAASVIGRSFDADEVRAASGRTEEEVVHALEELIDGGFLEDQGDGRLDFRHDLVRHHARSSLSAVRRRLLHQRLADHLLRRHRDAVGPHSGRIAQHLEESGRLEEAAFHRVAAAEHTRSVFAHQEAMRHYEAALALRHPDVTGLHLGIGDLHTLSGDYSSALESYRTAAAQADNGELAVVEHRLGEIEGRLGHWELAEHHFAEADCLTTDPTARIELLIDWARLSSRAGDETRSHQLIEDAAAQAELSIDEPAVPMVPIMQGAFNDDTTEGREQVQEGLDLARRLPQPRAEAAGLIALSRLARRQGSLDEAIEHARSGLAVLERIGDRHRQAAIHDFLADLLHESGDEEAAMAELTKAVQIFAEVGTGGLEPEIWKATPW